MNRHPLFGTDAPLIAILRGVEPAGVSDIAHALLEAGVRWIEVPLNSPSPFDSIERLVAASGARAVVGAGTVTSREEVDRLAATGARLCVSPHCDPALVAHAKASGLLAIPGVTKQSPPESCLHGLIHALITNGLMVGSARFLEAEGATRIIHNQSRGFWWSLNPLRGSNA